MHSNTPRSLVETSVIIEKYKQVVVMKVKEFCVRVVVDYLGHIVSSCSPRIPPQTLSQEKREYCGVKNTQIVEDE